MPLPMGMVELTCMEGSVARSCAALVMPPAPAAASVALAAAELDCEPMPVKVGKYTCAPQLGLLSVLTLLAADSASYLMGLTLSAGFLGMEDFTDRQEVLSEAALQWQWCQQVRPGDAHMLGCVHMRRVSLGVQVCRWEAHAGDRRLCCVCRTCMCWPR